DTWVFDPRVRRWSRRATPAAPSPRANARLRADGEGRLVLEGGYVYTSSTVYLAAQYRAAPGRWVYDPAADRWSGPGLEPANDRAYREGPFRPEDFLQGPRPDRAATDRRLKALPANTWVALNPPHRPHLNRGWGKVALDPRDDLVLLWGGGHSAHGGTDVAHYHLATNRWEQTVPVSFPLGQLFTSHRYPEGYTFNGRPWITTHSYNAYGYAARPGTMVFGGRVFHDYVYDPVAADWVGRFDKARAMQDKRPYFDVVMEAAGDDLYAWSRTGGLFVLNPRGDGWIRVLSPQAGMPRVLVDQSGMLYDDRRDRLVFVTQTAWRKPFDGVLYLYDRSAPGPAKVETLIPANAKAAGVTAFFGRMLYDPLSDLYWMNASLPVRDPDGRLRHIAFDPRENLWVSVAVGGANIFGKRSTPDINVINHAVDLVFDRKRGLIWAADGNGAVHVLRPDRAAMDIRPLGQVGRP
ncbi:MAG: hypothetical protein KDE22_10520, partial [Rhodobacterales bacterium]|nr:hypothetical protein [Rhodobacterales bacterium]